MREPRSIKDRLAWFLANPPDKVGMCARTCWLALGGDYGNPPAWGAASANEVYDKAIASGNYHTGEPLLGGLIVWKYGRYGHTALSLSGNRILTTDPPGRPGKTGEEFIDYPHRWGATASRRIWLDTYNGVPFPVGAPKEEDDVAISKKDASRIATRVWREDVVPSPSGPDSDNPTWMAGSYMRHILLTLQRIEALLEESKGT